MLDEFDEDSLRGTRCWSFTTMMGIAVLAICAFVFIARGAA